jgi:hypothetical protein
MDIIRKSIERGMNERGDSQLSSNHQSGDNNCNDAQDFHVIFLQG